MADWYEVSERLYLTEDGQAVPLGHPKARWLYAVPGHRLPADEARQRGLLAEPEPEEEPEADDAPGLTDLGGGWYELPDGQKVRGRDDALAALAEED